MKPARTVNLTTLTPAGAILRIALPASGLMLLTSLYYLVDAFWVGRLGAGPLAAASACTFLMWTFHSFAETAETAAGTLAAQAVGADRPDLVRAHLRHCIFAGLGLAAFFMAAALALRGFIFLQLGLEPATAAMAADYLTPFIIGMPALFVTLPLAAAFRGTGDAVTPMVLTGLTVALNAALNPVLIFGWGASPALGLAGSAWATAFCNLFTAVAGGAVLAHRGLFPGFGEGPRCGTTAKDLRLIGRIGLPIALNGALFSVIYLGLARVLAEFGSNPVAAVGLGHKIEALPYFVANGFSIAASVLVGQYVGAGNPDEAARMVKKIALWAWTAEAPIILGILFGIEPVLRLFIDDPAVVVPCAEYLRIAALGWALGGVFEYVMIGAFSGTGHTWPALVIGVAFTALRIPVAWLLAVVLGMGPTGVWLAVGVSMVVKGGLLSFWFSRGTWRRIRIAA